MTLRGLGHLSCLFEVGTPQLIDGIEELTDLLRLSPRKLIDRPDRRGGFAPSCDLGGF